MKSQARVIWFVGLLFLTLTGHLGAQTSYFGTPQCSNWLNPRIVSGISIERSNNSAWLAGFLSGINSAMDKDLLAGENLRDLEQKVSERCMNKPSSSLSDVALALALQLKRKKGS